MKLGMTTVICGAIGIGLFGCFLIGLAVSIGSIAFAIVVAIVLLLAVAEYVESAREGLRRNRG